MKIRLHDTFAELISPYRGFCAEQQRFPFFCTNVSIEDCRIPVLEQPLFHDHILVIASRRSVQIRLREINHAEALFHPRNRIVFISSPYVQNDVVRRDLRLSREELQRSPHTGSLSIFLHQFIKEYHVLAVCFRITLIPVFVRSDIYRITAEHRIVSAQIVIVQSLHEFSRCLRFCRFICIAAVDVQRQHLSVIVRLDRSEPVNLIRILLRISYVRIRVGRRVNFRDQVNSARIRHIFQISVIIFCIDRIAVYFIKIFKPLAGICLIFRQARESIALKTVHAVPLRTARKSFRAVGKIIVKMKLELIHLVPGQDLCIILEILKAVRNPSHIKHHAADLIVRIVADHAARNIIISVILPQDLLCRDSAVESARVSAAVDAHSVLICRHEIAFIASVIYILCLRFDIDISGRCISCCA